MIRLARLRGFASDSRALSPIASSSLLGIGEAAVNRTRSVGKAQDIERSLPFDAQVLRWRSREPGTCLPVGETKADRVSKSGRRAA
ncbi:MAG: hypothetical protein Kilf2KO_25680 [Rhodospirillales bacterium]